MFDTRLQTGASCRALYAWRTHQVYGFPRFFAFETLVLLIVWNADRWFRDPMSIQQIFSWIIFAASTALAAHGLHLLRSVGKAQRRVMEDTETVVEGGVYRFILRVPGPTILTLLLTRVIFASCNVLRDPYPASHTLP
jgi:hypothetical protein